MKNLHLCNPPKTEKTQCMLKHISSKTIMIYTRVNKKILANTKGKLHAILEYQNNDYQYFKINHN